VTVERNRLRAQGSAFAAEASAGHRAHLEPIRASGGQQISRWPRQVLGYGGPFIRALPG